MSLKVRFAVLFSLLVLVILLFSVSIIFLLYTNFNNKEFYGRVTRETIGYFQLYLFKDRYNEDMLPTAASESTLVNKRVAVYNSSLRLLNVSPASYVPQLPPAVFRKARQKKTIQFIINSHHTVVIYQVVAGQPYFIVGSGYDRYGRRKIDNLRLILIATVICGLLISGGLAFFYVKQVMDPLAELTAQMKQIGENNLDKRVTVRRPKDELGVIAKSFNDMLNRLQNAFEMRKSFVQHASHELRTPLSNMLVQTEVALNQDLQPHESKKIFQSLKEDQQHLIELTNALLLLSKYEKLDLLIDKNQVRVDEVIYESISEVKSLIPEATILFDFANVPDDENLLVISGNEVLLRSAFQNLIKNGCQYSPDAHVQISIAASSKEIHITFDSRGIHLNPEEREGLFMPFFRGENYSHKKGYGLGLSIVHRIVGLHGGAVFYEPAGECNRFTIRFVTVEA